MLLKFVTFIISVLSFLGYSSWFECGYRSRPRCKSTQCSIRSSHSSGTFMEFWLLYVILLPYIKVPDHEYNAKFTIWCLRSLEIVLLQRLGYFPQWGALLVTSYWGISLLQLTINLWAVSYWICCLFQSMHYNVPLLFIKCLYKTIIWELQIKSLYKILLR